MNKIYTKNQIQISAFLLGPVAPLYFLKKNFELLGDIGKAKQTFQYGLLAIIIFWLVTPIIDAPKLSIFIQAVALPLAIGVLFDKHQIELVHKASYSSWRVLIIALLGLVIFLIIGFFVMLLYHIFSTISLELRTNPPT